MNYRTWLTQKEIGLISDAAFGALQAIDADYAGNSYNWFEEAGLANTSYHDAFILAQLHHLMPTHETFVRLFTKQGIPGNELYEFERYTRHAIEVPEGTIPGTPNGFGSYEDEDDLEDLDDLPF